jgi:RNA polymerase sigma factor (sigma-70 family)
MICCGQFVPSKGILVEIMNLKNLRNTELVKLCAQEPLNEAVWGEFCDRFHSAIQSSIYRECCRTGAPQRASSFGNVYEDLVQEVYVKLVSSHCKALREFKGASENSIFLYLGIIGRNVVRNYWMNLAAQKRASVEVPLEAPASSDEDSSGSSPEDEIRSRQFDLEDQLDEESLRQEIETILDQTLQGKNRHRDRLIFQLAIYEGFTAEEISSRFDFDLSAKGIGNLLSQLKHVLKEELLEKRMSRHQSVGKS